VPFGDVNCFPVPEGIADEQALFLSDAVPTGWTGADFCDITPGDTVAVWGCGGVGLMAQRSAQIMGARVIAIDRLPERLALARERNGVETIDYEDSDSVLEDCASSPAAAARTPASRPSGWRRTGPARSTPWTAPSRRCTSRPIAAAPCARP
jgi:threonine dehydrogenase-like Zn-dependent dehydrogenase